MHTKKIAFICCVTCEYFILINRAQLIVSVIKSTITYIYIVLIYIYIIFIIQTIQKNHTSVCDMAIPYFSTVSQPNEQVAVLHCLYINIYIYASYDSIPYSLADSVRLESSSKGSSCPAVE